MYRRSGTFLHIYLIKKMGKNFGPSFTPPMFQFVATNLSANGCTSYHVVKWYEALKDVV